ncbi:ran GTPase-activating protein 1 isoform X2 [Schistocerca nitens]|uniref:ran GTPase-activating protein 1 isoform X2 n=1 Tax=Schistocerca nitens TaxID=7011 RepID=UPI00211865B6|nr:ran GTPase-activating protein 1 isoform X2 [Schistocerca nitens]
MSLADLEEVTKKLGKTNIEGNGVSFAGKSLKLDTEIDAKEVVDAIASCEDMQFLNMEGNTLGVDAAKAIAKALESHKEFKQALWKDMFTGRMKTEIPLALKHLSSGLMLAGAQLTVLDLSDNAFGPVGVEGLVTLLMSSTCYSLEVLKLNNNGLGITGGKMLAKGLLDCHRNSKSAGRPLALKVFIAGRNRLENEGAKALAEVFKTVGTLEHLSMPQNGIYHVGITAICEALTHNPNLKILDLNDNTITAKGALSVANALSSLQKLEEINLGDCLLKTKGATLLATALKKGHLLLKEVHLGYNEIGAKGGLALAEAMRNKGNLKILVLQGNQFGDQGRQELQSELKHSGRIGALGSLSEDEDEEEEDDDDEDKEDSESVSESEEENSVTEGLEEVVHIQITDNKSVTQVKDDVQVNLKTFLNSPTAENFASIGSGHAEIIIAETKRHPKEKFLEKFMPLLMAVSSLSTSNSETANSSVLSCCNTLYKELFDWANTVENISIVNNSLLAYLGLIKSEDKNLKPPQNVEGCLLALDYVVKQDYFPQSTKDTLMVFLDRATRIQVNSSTKQRLLSNLQQRKM